MKKIIINYKYKSEILEKIIEIDGIPRMHDIIPEFELDEGVIFPIQVMSVILPSYLDGKKEIKFSDYPKCYCVKTTYENIR